MESEKFKRGFIAATSVIIIGAVIVLLIIGMLSGARSEIERGTAKEKGTSALSLANLCMEIVLERLRENPNYRQETQEKIDVVGGSCYILSVTGTGKITAKTKGEVEGHARKIKAEVTISNKVKIIDWREID
jgi:hypothetical protein